MEYVCSMHIGWHVPLTLPAVLQQLPNYFWGGGLFKCLALSYFPGLTKILSVRFVLAYNFQLSETKSDLFKLDIDTEFPDLIQTRVLLLAISVCLRAGACTRLHMV